MDTTVDARTVFEFQLQIRTSADILVEEGDYLVISLPVQGHSAKWDTGAGPPPCELRNGGAATSCEILNSREAKLTLAAQKNRVIHGSIGNFLNPASAKNVDDIVIRLYPKKKGVW